MKAPKKVPDTASAILARRIAEVGPIVRDTSSDWSSKKFPAISNGSSDGRICIVFPYKFIDNRPFLRLCIRFVGADGLGTAPSASELASFAGEDAK